MWGGRCDISDRTFFPEILSGAARLSERCGRACVAAFFGNCFGNK